MAVFPHAINLGLPDYPSLDNTTLHTGLETNPALPLFGMAMPLALGGLQETVVGITFATLCLVALMLRLWARRVIKTPLAFNDYMAIAATVFATALVSDTIVASFVAGLGRHVSDLTPATLSLFMKLNISGQLLWAAANTCIKFSILSLYTVLFPNKTLAYICYVAMALSMSYLITVTLEGFLLCNPVGYNWDKTIPGGRCKGQNAAYLVSGIFNLVLDAFIVALPMPKLFKLRMSLSRRLTVAAMFSLGALVIYLHNWDLNDVTYSSTVIGIYTILEPTLGVINASLPVMKPAFNMILNSRALNRTKQALTRGGSPNSSATTSRGRKRSSANKSMSYGRSVRLSDGIILSTVPSRTSLTENIGDENTITVTREWEIDSSRREDNERIAPSWNSLSYDVESCR